MLDKAVNKGAPPPPESYQEVNQAVQKLGPGNGLTIDSAQAYKKAARLHLVDNGVPHAAEVLKTSNSVSLVKYPITDLCQDPVVQTRTLVVRSYSGHLTGLVYLICDKPHCVLRHMFHPCCFEPSFRPG